MLKKTIDRIKKDFGEKLLQTVVHELSHIILSVKNNYKIKEINLKEKIVDGTKIYGEVEIEFSFYLDLIKDLCSTSYTGKFGKANEYKKIGEFYIELLLIGYASEKEFIGLNMDFYTSSMLPTPPFEITFRSTIDGKRCYLIFANIYNNQLQMSRSISHYYANVIKLLQSANFKFILEKLLLKAFYYNFGFFKLRKCYPKIRRKSIFCKLLQRYEI